MLEPFHRILSVSASAGFLEEFPIEFHDSFTCLIGGRGSGKTTALEFLRFALNAMPKNPKQAGPIEELIKANLGHGTLRVDFETRDGLRYHVERDALEPKPRVFDADGEETDLTLEHGGFFGIDVFSQNQIEQIARDRGAQLELIDRFRSSELREVARALQAVRSRLDSNAARLVALISEDKAAELSLSDLPQIEEALKGLQQRQGGRSSEVATQIELKAQRDQEERRLGEARRAANTLRGRVQELERELGQRLTLAYDPALLEGPNGATLRACVDTVQLRAKESKKHLGEARRALKELEATLQGQAKELKQAHKGQDAGYAELMKEHEAEKELARQELELQESLNKLAVEVERRDTTRANLRSCNESRKRLLREYDTLRLNRRKIRREIVKDLNTLLKPQIRVALLESEGQEEFSKLLHSHLKGQGKRVSPNLPKIVRNTTPQTFGQLVTHRDAERLARECEVSTGFASFMIDRLAGTRELYEIEAVDIEDGVQIALKDGKDYKASDALSTGQRCTVILPLLLLESAQPLVIDQPEDNLDNRYIFDVVVKKIEEVREGRQLIFATHNPNLPVLGEAGKVLMLESDGRQVVRLEEGSVDDMRGPIEEILEGGRDAFRLRAQRYGHSVD